MSIQKNEENSLSNRLDFEDHLVSYVKLLAERLWSLPSEITSEILSWTKSDNQQGMTLLHLAAVLGYTRLVVVLLEWRADNSNIILETEVDALRQDREGFTPLVNKLNNFFLKEYYVKVILPLFRCCHVQRDIWIRL